ncbi:MAG TPA: GNAT family N-acetyltransferase [Bryobacteraceae bacterium]|nr:GNAT family N-acetyltransferase [Bryobacteraceae bacterium]
MSDLKIHKLTTQAEFATVVQLQREIWGYADVELLPLRLFIVAEKIGGQVLGAFDGSRMVAFCLAIPGLKAGGKHYLHSHMLGVLPEYRNSGLGRQMKLMQREEALSRGIELIEWTFDPLELKNAYFNIERLGAVVRRFVRNQYGSTSSHLHGGLPTDRCTAEWWINSERVRNILEGKVAPATAIKERISIPSNISELRRSDPAHARQIQIEAASSFETFFNRRLAVVKFEKTEESGSYLLGEWALE